MDLFWLGHSCFRLKGKDSTVLMDPCPRSTGYTIGRQPAQVVTISHPHESHNYLEAIAGTPKVLDAPGEYEIGGVLLTGVRTFHDATRGAARGVNTAFVVEIDEVRVCHLGDIGHKPTDEQQERLSDIDVLLIPVGGDTTIDAVTAAEIVSQLEPKVVVPMHYATEATGLTALAPLDGFIKQMGIATPTPQPKLTLTRSSMPFSMQVTVLEYREYRR